MKITIAYTAEEAKKANIALVLLRSYLPDVRVHKSERHAPYFHLYLTTKKAGKPEEKPESIDP